VFDLYKVMNPAQLRGNLGQALQNGALQRIAGSNSQSYPQKMGVICDDDKSKT
jgi:hypothetical protein